MRPHKYNFLKFTLHIFFMLLLACVLSFFYVNAQAKYPKPTELKYINDYTSIINKNTKEYIVSVGKELEDKTGAQEVVVIIDSLEGVDIEGYANELFRTWGIGQKEKNNGLLILVAMKDRKWRVEVGTSLEGVITDIYSARIMDSVAAPRFKEGNYSEGIKEAYSIFADAIAKEYNVTLQKNQTINLPENSNYVSGTNGLAVGIPFLFLIILDFVFNRGRITRFLFRMAFLFGGRNGNNKGGGGFGGMGGGSSSGGGSSGSW